MPSQTLLSVHDTNHENSELRLFVRLGAPGPGSNPSLARVVVAAASLISWVITTAVNNGVALVLRLVVANQYFCVVVQCNMTLWQSLSGFLHSTGTSPPPVQTP